jgi:hypothetical protein
MEQQELDVNTLTERQAILLQDLRSWATLQPQITTIMEEDEAKWLMRVEQMGKNRIRILDRIHARLNVLRLERERRNLAKGILPFN